MKTSHKKQKALQIIEYVFQANAGKGWDSLDAFRLLDQSPPARAIIVYHGLGDTSHNFQQGYMHQLDTQAITFVPDFLDHTNKPVRVALSLNCLWQHINILPLNKNSTNFIPEQK